MDRQEARLAAELEEALHSLARGRGKVAADKIRPIILQNLKRGRVQRYLGNNGPCCPCDYVWLVAYTFERLGPTLYQIQVLKSAEIWQPLFVTLQEWAYHYLLKIRFWPGQKTWELAIACAAEAGAQLVNAHFPYDTEFEPWATVLLQNVCRKQIGQARKPKNIPDRRLTSLNELLPILEDLSNGQTEGSSDLRRDLLAAVDKMSSRRRREMIRLRYFENLPYREIAERMGLKIGATYRLHFDAIEELRKILQESGYI